MFKILKKLGPGLLFAGAAIGVSHLVQSTKAGADFGFGLVWALLLVNIFKYPFFQFGPRYAISTGESLLDGYYKLGKWVLVVYFILTIATMFTIQTAVTIVTAGIASSLFSEWISFQEHGLVIWTSIILLICLIILFVGKYTFLDKLIKIIIISLSISTLLAVGFALNNYTGTIHFKQILPKDTSGILFLIAFMGWMPAPLDVSVWHSLWTLEKTKTEKKHSPKSALLDFNIGFIGTLILGICFLLLGSLIMHNSGQQFSDKASVFSNQLIQMYTHSLGNWAYLIIGIAALTTMFSTTLTTLDASPRAITKTTELLFNKTFKKGYQFWVLTLTIGTLCIFIFFSAKMKLLITIATILSFLTAPFYAITNYILIKSKHTPKAWRPSLKTHTISILGICFLIGFSLYYLSTL